LDHLKALGNPFIKNLMEEGLDRDKVRRASDRVWKTLGTQAAAQA